MKRAVGRPQTGMDRVHAKGVDLMLTQDATRRELAKTRAQVVGRTPGVQVGFAFTRAAPIVPTGTTTIPFDATEPLNTEGTEFLALDYTPKGIGNQILVEAGAMLSNTAANAYLIAALFRNAESLAIVANSQYIETATGVAFVLLADAFLVKSPSPIRFRLRAGANVAGTTRFNNGTGIAFNTARPSFIKVTEMLT